MAAASSSGVALMRGGRLSLLGLLALRLFLVLAIGDSFVAAYLYFIIGEKRLTSGGGRLY